MFSNVTKYCYLKYTSYCQKHILIQTSTGPSVSLRAADKVDRRFRKRTLLVCVSKTDTAWPSWSPQQYLALRKLLAKSSSQRALFNCLCNYWGDIRQSCRTCCCSKLYRRTSFLICLQATVAGESQNGIVMFNIFPASLIFMIECACQMMAGNLPKSCYGKQPQKLQPALCWISPAQYWYWQHSYTYWFQMCKFFQT